MTTPALSQTTLSALGRETNIIIRPIEAYMLPEGLVTDYAFERFTEVWNKLRSWDMTDYDVLCWLDADMLVLRNMDELLDQLNDGDVFGARFSVIC